MPKHPPSPTRRAGPHPPNARFSNVLSAEESVLVLIDPQAELLPAIRSGDSDVLTATIETLVRLAAFLHVPCISTSLAKGALNGAPWQSLTPLLVKDDPLRRETFNPFSHPEFERRVEAAARPTLLFCGLCPEGSLTQAALSALEIGYDVFVIADALGTPKPDAHRFVVERMAQSGVMVASWRQVTFEWLEGQKDDPHSQMIEEILCARPDAHEELAAYIESIHGLSPRG